MGNVGTIPATGYESSIDQTFTTPTGTTHTLTYSVASQADILVYVNNVPQEPGVGFTVSGTTLTTDTLVSGDTLYVKYLALARQTVTPGAGTITPGMLNSETRSYFNRNDIINGGLVVNQENQTAPADDAYTIGDLFLHVGEGTPVMSLETDGPQGTRPWQKMVLDANAQGGLVYFMSNDDVQDYIAAGSLSFGVQLRTVTGALIDNARIGILKWNSTADTITSDVVATWASDGTDPTLATNWSYENTPANLALTNAWQRFTVENVTVDSDTTNIAIFIWTDDGTITASDAIGFSEWQCNPGATVNDFSQPPISTVQDQVLWYVELINAGGDAGMRFGVGGLRSTTSLNCLMTFAPKRINGVTITNKSSTVTHYGGMNHVDANGTGTALPTYTNINGLDGKVNVNQAINTVGAAGQPCLFRAFDATAKILIDARH